MSQEHRGHRRRFQRWGPPPETPEAVPEVEEENFRYLVGVCADGHVVLGIGENAVEEQYHIDPRAALLFARRVLDAALDGMGLDAEEDEEYGEDV